MLHCTDPWNKSLLSLLSLLLSSLIFSLCSESVRQHSQSSDLPGEVSAQLNQPLRYCHGIIRPGQWKKTEPGHPLQVCLPRLLQKEFINIFRSRVYRWIDQKILHIHRFTVTTITCILEPSSLVWWGSPLLSLSTSLHILACHKYITVTEKCVCVFLRVVPLACA